MRIAVIGTGYVGLVTGAGLAEVGNDVSCVALDPRSAERLERGELAIYEPGLEDLVTGNREGGRLSFTADLEDAVRRAEVVIIALEVPVSADGRAELAELFGVTDRIATVLDEYKVIVNRSTVPVGTTERLKVRIQAHTQTPFGIVSNPAFLKEGDAVNDFMKPDRILVGTEDARAAEVLRRLFAPFVRTRDRIMVSDARSAELGKYAVSALLAARISFVNELALLCDELGADMEIVRRVLGADSRIGPKYLFVGPGFGGSHFTSDITMLLNTARESGRELGIVRASHEANQRQKRVLLDKLARAMSDRLERATVAVWGLAFKPRTDDIGEAPALRLIDGLLERGARVRVHDPQAMTNARALYGERIEYADSMYDAAQGADALVLVTEWHQYRRPDFKRLLQGMQGRLVVDGRNLWDPAELREIGFRYVGIGRS
ncbi:MAG TPA: UDP-glucose/GDP-mannose dehydrogenase family protein [Polyangiaceae bacterium]|jgi:UDPglucose 6-dehydrogenase|nr:UDP-glucose/GDP-mannose dehydrogenase family protein [Polyangiaceae bacterium]